MMQSYCEIMSQRREQEVILLQEQAFEEKQELLAEEQVANPSEPSPVSYFYNADYDNISTPSTTYTIHLTKNEVKRIQQILKRTLFDAITPDFPITDSLSMGDEHLSTILETESDELIKSSVENLVPTPSESKDLSDIEKSDLIESLLNRDTLIISSPKFDSLLGEFFGELAHINLIPPGINEADFDPEEEIHLIEKLLYDNSSPRPPEEFNSENSDVVIESFSPSPIHVEGSDYLIEEIDIFLAPDDSIHPGIENDNYNSEEDILFLRELLTHDPLSLPENESFHFDCYYVLSSPRPPENPSDDVYFDIEPDTGVFTKVVDDISDNSTRELYVHVNNVLPTLPTLSPMFDTLLPFSSKNDDKVFNPGILASNEEKSPHLLSHQGFKAFPFFSKSPMMIYGEDIPILDVSFLYSILLGHLDQLKIAPDFEDSRARGFVLHSLEL
ncbi:hypothetical protein Tco_0307919 [Tanacetum coccineum]